MKNILLFLWTLPQSLFGALLSIFCKKEVHYDKPVWIWCFNGAISLGMFIFTEKNPSEFRVAHEYGHYKQSLILSWLYLLVIGIPSITWACIHTLFLQPKKNYYDFYTEAWANKLAGYKTWFDTESGITRFCKIK